jgi:DNA-binding PadR family transcriptional regulator
MYGYEIIQALKESSSELYSMSEGTLYPALKRLETQDFITSYWQEQENKRRRKYYQITDDGQKAIEIKLRDWKQLNNLIAKWSEGGALYE